jgi:hypothetical protein
MSETVEIECPKCKARMRMHQPLIVRIDNGLISQVTLVPSWSADERQCKGCGSIVSPIFAMQIPMLWAAMEPDQIPEAPPEPSRIVIPSLRPLNLTDKMRNRG